MTRKSWLQDEIAFFSRFDGDLSASPTTMSVIKGATSGGVEYLQLSDADSTAANTGGYYIRLAEAVQAAVNGHHIAVSVVARGAQKSRSRFALAYSSAGMNNSGWRWFDAASKWSVATLRWDVPPAQNGVGDFLAILPDGEGRPGTQFCYLAIAIIPDAP